MNSVAVEAIAKYHSHNISSCQCGSINMQEIGAPLSQVWHLIRKFDRPQAYKLFVKECFVLVGSGSEVGSVREVHIKSELPATTSIERLDELDDEHHVMRFSIIGGDHRLTNYQSTISLHEISDEVTMVIESYIVDVPLGLTKEETCAFIDNIIKFNMRSLAEKIARFV
ncbi:Polyketide cyclase/dehydrase protein [Dioscorea alata]|uniref:Polyketide cyclase/dehydrase protein n=1 Tax=Dioscorea alata TaxID=55571 RepID=A0ACB7WCN4_DIOAL|nr:Polyketide cyclase/dehydrase protein [Dioscorea alata]